MSFVGVEIGGTKIQVVTGDKEGQISSCQRFKVELSRGGEGIRHRIAKVLSGLKNKAPIAAIGIGFGGPVNRETGHICCSHQIEGWDNFPIQDWLGEQVDDVPVIVENDANTAALGEAIRGAGRGMNPVFYVTLGSGIGGGLIVDEKIYHGAIPSETEIGHLRLKKAGVTLESRCSGWAVDRRIRDHAGQNPDSLLNRLTTGLKGGEAGCLLPAIEQEDAGAKAILDEICSDLGFGLSHVVHLINPQTIILGGGLSKIGEPLRAGVESAMRRMLMNTLQPGPAIQIASLGEDAVPVGALLLALGTTI